MSEIESTNPGEDTEIRQWFKEIDLAEKRDKPWRKTGSSIIARFRNEGRVSNKEDANLDEFNILWANTEVMRPALYAKTPRPDIRRRFSSKEDANRHLVETLERCANFIFDDADIDSRMISAVNDMILPGRGTIRVRYAPTVEEEQVTSEKIAYQDWDWDKLLLGPGSRWEELPWIAFIHELDKGQIEKLSPEFAEKATLDANDEEKTEKDKRDEAQLYKRSTFYEVWDKRTRQVRWIAKAYKDDFVKIEEDPLGLKAFFPVPKPMYCVESTTSLVPIPEFVQYQRLADQLEDVTVRMGRITRALRVRGIYDSTMSELNKLFDAGDNEMIPAEGLSRLIESGGIDKAIWMMPNNDLANVLQILQQYRDSLIQQIYELTGISDILRGASNPHETLGAQEMKANFGSQRLDKKRHETQRFVRDVLRLTLELVAEKFQPQSLKAMTGLPFLMAEEKQQMEMQVQMQQQQAQQQQMQQMQQAQMMGQQPPEAAPPPEVPPEVQYQLSLPTWEDLKAMMTSETMREYIVDIETDSTIQADQQADQDAIASMLQGVSQFGHGVGPLMEVGVLTQDAAKQVLISMFRRYRLGRELEEAIENSVGEEKPDPEAEAQQLEQQKQQAEMQADQQKMQAEQQKMQAEQQIRQEEMAAERERMQLELTQARESHQMEMESIRMKRDEAREKHEYQMREIAAKERGDNT
ncbi:hypothetical protein OAA60_00630 [Porticoccaceae bacterium]|nr:hypothetical protein [Porticoccaceae bacterium]